jgi:hypothetical protein
MNGVVEIDAGQDRKYVGLQERDQQLKRGSVQRWRRAQFQDNED